MFAYCNNNPVNSLDENGHSPYGKLTLWDYYLIHRMVQIECVIHRGYDMEVSVKSANGKKGRLDLYDFSQNAYYEVKSEGASQSPNTPLQMQRYDSSVIDAKRYESFNIVQPPSRGTQYISGTLEYGLYDVHYELRAPGLIVYEPQINWSRVATYATVVALIVAGVATNGQSLPASMPIIGELIPALAG